MQVLESQVEQVFVDAMVTMGITTLKLNLVYNRGWPDRLIILPNGRVIFIELKRPGGTLEPLQKHRHEQLENLGHDVKTFDDAKMAIRYVVMSLD